MPAGGFDAARGGIQESESQHTRIRGGWRQPVCLDELRWLPWRWRPGWVGPSLIDGRWRYGGEDEEIFASIFYGRPKGMPAYGGVTGEEGVWMLVSYLKSQSPPSVVPTTSYEDMDRAAAAPAAPAEAPAAAATAASGAPKTPEQMLAQYGCTACHAVDKKVIGPAFKDVAAKYKGNADAVPALETKVKNGGSGVWGAVPMPPNPQVPEHGSARAGHVGARAEVNAGHPRILRRGHHFFSNSRPDRHLPISAGFRSSAATAVCSSTRAPLSPASASASSIPSSTVAAT